MISKEIFLEVINNIKLEEQRLDRISSVLENDCIDGWAVFKPSYSAQNVHVLLKAIFGEEGYELISWWLYEDVEKLIYKADTNEIIADLTKPEDLYDYIITL